MKIIKKMFLLMVTGALVLQMVACDNKNEGQNNKGQKNETQYEITMDEYNLALEKNMLQYKEQINGNADVIKRVEEVTLEQLILDKVLTNEASIAKVNITDEEVNTEYDRVKAEYTETDNFNDYLIKNNLTEESYKENIKNQFLINAFLRIKAEEIIKNNPSSSELKEFYEKNINILKQVRASHILVSTEEAAKDVKKKLEEGAVFEELARDISTCPSSTAGGDLGYFTANEMVVEFSNAAFAMEIGQISEPVKSEFGYHIIKLVDIRDTYEKADKNNVLEQYRMLAYNKMLANYIDNTNVKLPKDLEKIRERVKGTE